LVTGTFPESIRQRAVFVDAVAFYAAMDSRDQNHTLAQEGFARIVRERRPLVTSNLVVAETYALARSRLGHGAASAWLGSLDLSIEYQQPSDHERVVILLARYSDKGFSYTDAASFVMMERLDIPLAFTFDAHYRQYGIAVMP
jgi:predicted nucleic acid-binding protein